MHVMLNFENDLLRIILCSRWSETARIAVDKMLMNQFIDWEKFLLDCEIEVCSPLAYDALHSLQEIPNEVKNKLRNAYINCGSANLIYLSELEKNMVMLQRANVHPILLKGAALILSIYKNIALRPMLDIDLLIKNEEVEKTRQIFSNLGYIPTRMEYQDILHLYENEIGLSKLGPINFKFELHWNLFDSPYHQSRIPIENFWHDTREVSLQTTDVSILSPNNHLLHLCGHLHLHHQGKELLWLHDIALLLVEYKNDIDWETVIKDAQIYGLVIPLQLTLAEISKNWYVPLQSDLVGQILRLVPSKYEKNHYRRITRLKRPAGSRLLDDLQSLPTKWQKLHFGWINLFPSPEYMRRRYKIRHLSLIPFYYLYRWYIGIRDMLR